jgi:hypothetical protein
MTNSIISKQTRNNWWIDFTLFSSAIIAALSGIYFLYLPTGGYQGGRNPYYNLQILFSRQTWDNLHTWGGVAMIVAVTIHLVLHWTWVKNMTKSIFKQLIGKGSRMNARGRWNLILNGVVGLSFLLTALSGIYFLFFASGHGATDPMILFTRTTWDLIHTWAGILLISAAVAHFVIHWKWVTKVTGRMLAAVRNIRPVSPSTPTIYSKS